MEKELIYKRQKIYKYDKYGNKNIEYCKVFDQDDKPLLSTEFDKKGFVITNNIWDYSENKIIEHCKALDGDGYRCNISSIEIFDNSGSIIEEVFNYNSQTTKTIYHYDYFWGNKRIIQKHILVYSYNRKSGEYYRNYHYNRNRNCVLIEDSHIFAPPFAPSRTECFYDENDQKIKEITTEERKYEDDLPRIVTSEFFYNLDGVLIRKTERSHLDLQKMDENIFQDYLYNAFREYCYDDKGNIISKTFSEGDDPYPDITIYKYTYDDNGNIIEKKHYNKTGLYETEKHTFDEENKPQESFYYDKKGKLKSLHQWEYIYGDEDDNVSQRNVFQKEELDVANRVECLYNVDIDQQIYLIALQKLLNPIYPYTVEEWIEDHRQLFNDTIQHKTNFNIWKMWFESQEKYDRNYEHYVKTTYATLFVEKYYFIEKALSNPEIPTEYFETFIRNWRDWDFPINNLDIPDDYPLNNLDNDCPF